MASPDDGLEALLESLASRTPVDWEEAERRAGGAAERARLAALRGIERIASFSHEQWRRFGPLVERARTLEGTTLDGWLRGLEPGDAADLRALLARPPAPGDAGRGAGAGAEAALESAAGQTVGAYTLEAPIGAGGMGEVWSARRSDGRFEGRVAIKLLRLPLVSRHGRGRFQREGEILARLRHPHIAQLLDAGVTAAGQPYLVLEHVDGVPIDRHCDAHALGTRGRVRLFLEVLEAVAHAQANLVLHRDLKPSNILVDTTGAVKLLDFGIGKLLEEEGSASPDSEVTLHAGRAFTPEFAAPEQLLGEPATTATDVYSAGAVLYLLLTGRHPTPVGQGSPLERMKIVLESEPRLASAAVAAADDREAARRRRELRGDLDNILARALRKPAAERYASAAAFADDLRRYLAAEPVAARAGRVGYRVGRFVRRHRGPVIATGAAMLALAALAAIALSQRTEARRQRDAAREQARRADAFTSVVTSLLSQAGPGGGALTPEQLLDRAVAEMEARYRDDPAFLVGMLIRISGRYYDLQDSKKELATLVEAERVARSANDPALVYDVQVNTVETELSLGRVAEATRRIEEARRLLPALDPAPDLDDYLRAEAKVARARDDMPAALGYLERARKLLESRGEVDGNAYPGILSEIGYTHMVLGDTREAYETGVALVELDRRQGRGNSQPGLISRTSLASSIFNVGEVQRARAAFEELIPENGRDGASLPPTITHRYADVLSRLGRHAEALRMIAVAAPAADSSGNRVLQVRVHLAEARILLRAGKLSESRAALARVEPEIEAVEGAQPAWFVDAGRLRAELALAEGRAGDAVREAEAAVRRTGFPEKRHAASLAGAVLTLARAQLAAGDAAHAAATAREAVELFEKDALDPARSADVGEALLALGEAQRALGQGAEAKRSYARASSCLRSGLGPDHEKSRLAAHRAAES